VSQLIVVAGCNGSGKSTFIRSISHFLAGTNIIDPDVLFAELSSWKTVLTSIDDTLARRRDLVLETTLAGKTMLRRMRLAKSHSYEVTLIFIGTSSAALNVGRIMTRTRLGGHAISTEDVRRRWFSTLERLPMAVAIADRALLLDNSSSTERFAFVAELERGIVLRRADTVPEWARSALPQVRE
jgi:predicted ABC-type ATPase